MKKIPIIILILLIVISCSHKPRNGERWSHLNPEQTLIMDSLEMGFISNIPKDSLFRLIDRLKSSGKITSTHPEIEWYWKCRILRHYDSHDTAKKYLDKAVALCDSVKHPYEWARISQYRASYTEDILMRLNMAAEALNYFTAAADTFMIATMHIDLGQIYRELEDTSHSIKYINSGIKEFSAIGFDAWASKLKINLIPAYWERGDSTYARQMLLKMGNDQKLMSDSDFRVAWWFDMWTYLDDKDALDSLLSMTIQTHQLSTHQRSTVYLMTAFQNFIDNDLEEAKKYCLSSWELTNPDEDDKLRYELKMLLSEILNKTGDGNGAYLHSAHASAILIDTIYRKELAHKTAILNAKSTLEKKQLQESFEYQQRLLKTGIIAGIVVIILLCVIVGLKIRNSHHQLAVARTTIDLERNRHLLAKAVQSMKEKSRTIKELSEQIESSSAKDDLPGLKRHKQVIALSNQGDSDFDQLSILVEEVSSTLISNLRKSYPNMQPGMQKMAVLIVCGLTTKEISSILNIQPDSVKKARYRLKNFLGLNGEENLAEFLKTLS